jgi:hypothetical protein
MNEVISASAPTQQVVMRCADCHFALQEQLPQQVVRVLVCHHSPPSMSMTPTPRGIQATTVFPVLQPDQFCFQFRPRGAAHGAGPLPANADTVATPTA